MSETGHAKQLAENAILSQFFIAAKEFTLHADRRAFIQAVDDTSEKLFDLRPLSGSHLTLGAAMWVGLSTGAAVMAGELRPNVVAHDPYLLSDDVKAGPKMRDLLVKTTNLFLQTGINRELICANAASALGRQIEADLTVAQGRSTLSHGALARGLPAQPTAGRQAASSKAAAGGRESGGRPNRQVRQDVRPRPR